MNEGAPRGQYERFPSFHGWCDDFDSAVVDSYADLLDQARASATDEAMRAAVEVATRYAAVDTGAIEGLYTTSRGFTRTIAEQTATWEAALRQHGKDVERSIADALNGYEMVLDLVTGRSPITESWIRQLHETICASQTSYEVITAIGPQRQTLPKGQYKQMPNNPTSTETGRVHHYAPVVDTPMELARFLDELSSDEFEVAHPVLQAAYAHYAFVCIHPFADGNGRVARALASVFPYRSPGVPLVVFADQKDVYIDVLEAADDGRPGSFVAFIAERTIDTIDLVRATLTRGNTTPPEESLAALRRDLAGRAGPGHGEYDAASKRIMGLIREQLTVYVDGLDLPPGVEFMQFDLTTNPPAQAPTGYRAAGHAVSGYQIVIPTPVHVLQRGDLQIWSARPEADGPDFLGTASTSDLTLAVRLRDIVPAESAVLGIKIANWVEAVIANDLAAFRAELHRALVASGYQADV
ncbi:MAG: Fic family protein [Actinomycetota bacterium]|nr:Fic family protein [Actinomycetota bacterium]